MGTDSSGPQGPPQKERVSGGPLFPGDTKRWPCPAEDCGKSRRWRFPGVPHPMCPPFRVNKTGGVLLWWEGDIQGSASLAVPGSAAASGHLSEALSSGARSLPPFPPVRAVREVGTPAGPRTLLCPEVSPAEPPCSGDGDPERASGPCCRMFSVFSAKWHPACNQ